MWILFLKVFTHGTANGSSSHNVKNFENRRSKTITVFFFDKDSLMTFVQVRFNPIDISASTWSLNEKGNPMMWIQPP